MGVFAEASYGVVLHRRQAVQSAGGGGLALRPDVAGERKAAGLPIAPQNIRVQCEVHPYRGAASGAFAQVASCHLRGNMGHDRRSEGRQVRVKI